MAMVDVPCAIHGDWIGYVAVIGGLIGAFALGFFVAKVRGSSL
jgi:hypothetical protein